MTESIYNYSMKDIRGNDIQLENYRGKVLLVVNTASKCGLTPQFKELEALYQQNADQGLEILGFPCNQFGQQEQGSDDQISEFCQLNYGVSFSMFSKIEVNGKDTSPLYRHLKGSAPGLFGSKRIKWNFTKFLIGRDGQVIKRFAPTTKPEKLISQVELALRAA